MRSNLRVLFVATLLVAACRTPPSAAASPDGGTPPPAAAGPRRALSAHPEGPSVVVFLTKKHGEVPVEVELALTEAQHAKGLMFRKHLDAGHGMLFVFKDDDDRTFWMKNTLIPLDMIFVDNDRKVVGVVREAAPLTTTARDVGKPSRYVIEVPGGWARENGVEAGTKVRFEGVPGL